MPPSALSQAPVGGAALPAPAPVAQPRSGDQPEISPVPEPTTLLLVGTGLVGLAVTARRSRRRS